VRVYFFVVDTHDDRGFVDIFREVAARRGEDRVAVVNKQRAEVRLEHPLRATREVAGDLVRLRMTQIPPKIRRRGGRSEIALDADEGIGEETCFLYEPKHNVMGLESNRTGVSPSAVARYFTVLNSSGTQVNLTPIVDLSKLDDLKELTSISRFDLAVTADSEILSMGPPESLGSMIRAARELGSPTIEMHTSVGYEWKKKSLKLSKVAEIARFLLRRAPERVTELKISGENEAHERLYLDMLSGRLQYETLRDDSLRRTSYEARRRVLREAIAEQAVNGKFGPPRK
jgi:hypothetical protein